ncbi:hypothetical protein [Fluviicola taffensis]|uniref:Uncharacterized protein n=1 Tax=Fluviicola taffensis (strain DSM 16823 / NCIMB 13979 / RW262) TaxID=755732 RepID=F2IDB6_FLUTR|nr:hypothetical protein [Fluviicola taffensis]AEA45531.1 hypothetical protein Fluta_3562 [Fluviicola taffensis DSM 16823]
MEESRKVIQAILEQKAGLKQDIFQDTKNHFERFKKHLLEEIGALRLLVEDSRIRLHVEYKGEFQIQVYIGSDVLVFQMHTNVFKLPDEHPLWQTDYLKEDKSRGYYGIINIYNFLAESYLKNRSNDVGYLIGRVFINKDEHFMVEGKGQLGFLFRDFTNSVLTDSILTHIIQVSFAYALEFDLLTPPYEIVSKVTVFQMHEMEASSQMSTGKRLGFKFEAEDRDIF